MHVFGTFRHTICFIASSLLLFERRSHLMACQIHHPFTKSFGCHRLVKQLRRLQVRRGLLVLTYNQPNIPWVQIQSLHVPLFCEEVENNCASIHFIYSSKNPLDFRRLSDFSKYFWGVFCPTTHPMLFSASVELARECWDLYSSCNACGHFLQPRSLEQLSLSTQRITRSLFNRLIFDRNFHS